QRQPAVTPFALGVRTPTGVIAWLRVFLRRSAPAQAVARPSGGLVLAEDVADDLRDRARRRHEIDVDPDAAKSRAPVGRQSGEAGARLIYVAHDLARLALEFQGLRAPAANHDLVAAAGARRVEGGPLR